MGSSLFARVRQADLRGRDGDPAPSGAHPLAPRRTGGAARRAGDADGDAALGAAGRRRRQRHRLPDHPDAAALGGALLLRGASRRTSCARPLVLGLAILVQGRLSRVALRRLGGGDARSFAGPAEAPDRDPRLVGGRPRPPALRGDRHRRRRGLLRPRSAAGRPAASRAAPALEGPVDRTDPPARRPRSIPPTSTTSASGAGEGRDLVVFFHDHALNPESGIEDDFGTIFRVDGRTGEVLERHDGFIWQRAVELRGERAPRSFLVDLHVQLYLPSPWGLIVTGILGLMMMAAVVSGVLMHRHLIRDLFVAERPGAPPRLGARPPRARRELGHPLRLRARLHRLVLQLRRLGRPAAGRARPPSAATRRDARDALRAAGARGRRRPAPLASLDYIIADSRRARRLARRPTSASRTTAAPTRASTSGTTRRDGGLLYVTNVYDGPSRAFLGRQAPLGTAPSAGGTLYGLMYPLHFGHFAGIALQGRLGRARRRACASSSSRASASGRRRRADAAAVARLRPRRADHRLRPAVRHARLGLRLLPVAPGRRPVLLDAGELRARRRRSRSASAWRGARRRPRSAPLYQRLLGAACLALPVLRIATGGMDWAEALLPRQTDILTVDLLLFVAGAACWLAARRGAPRSRLVAGAGRVSVARDARRRRRSASRRSATSPRPIRSAAARSACRRPRGGSAGLAWAAVLLPGRAGAGLERRRRVPDLVRRRHRRRLGPGRDLPATGRRLARARRGGRRGGPRPGGAARRRARRAGRSAAGTVSALWPGVDRLGALERRVEELEAEVAALRRGRRGASEASSSSSPGRPAGAERIAEGGLRACRCREYCNCPEGCSRGAHAHWRCRVKYISKYIIKKVKISETVSAPHFVAHFDEVDMGECSLSASSRVRTALRGAV